MASLLNAHLPSDDEEDDDYNPEADKTAEPEDRMGKKTARQSKRRRGATAAAEDEDGEPANNTAADHNEEEEDKDDPKVQAKRAKINALWQLMNDKSVSASAPAAPTSSKPKVSGSSSLASLCQPVKSKKVDPDAIWMRSLGLLPAKGKAPGTQAAPKPSSKAAPTTTQKEEAGESSAPANTEPSAPDATATPDVTAAADAKPGPASNTGTSDAGSGEAGGSAGPSSGTGPAVSQSARSAAAAALAAAREAVGLGSSKSYGKVAVTETRKFAGKDIQVTVQVDAGSKEAAKAAEKAAAPKSGLDAVLADLEKKKKVGVLDKSAMDWQSLKAQDQGLEEELETHKRSGTGYLDKVNFLQRSQLREYELERDAKLASDVRTRGRL